MIRAVFLAVSLLPLALSMNAQAVTTMFGSDTTWEVYDVDGKLLDLAQNVCLDRTALTSIPKYCPPAATSYGYAGAGWTATSTIPGTTTTIPGPGATWIWAPTVTGETSPAAMAEFKFKKVFYLCGPPQEGKIVIAADDSAEVFINTIRIGSSASSGTFSSISIPSTNLAEGLNTLEVIVKNGPNPANCQSGKYQCNPAGVLLGALFKDELTMPLTCTGTDNKKYEVGKFEQLACSAGLEGSKSHQCICYKPLPILPTITDWGPLHDNCVAPPVKCTGDDGKRYAVNEKESLICPAGQIGSSPTSHTCLMSGSWDVPLGACRPPVTCTGVNGQAVPVGTEETITCPPGRTGFQSHICQSNGNWGPTTGTCPLPVCEGENCICGSREQGETKTCPPGTTCQQRSSSSGSKPWYCFFRPDADGCRVTTVTADWYCDP